VLLADEVPSSDNIYGIVKLSLFGIPFL